MLTLGTNHISIYEWYKEETSLVTFFYNWFVGVMDSGWKGTFYCEDEMKKNEFNKIYEYIVFFP